MAEVLIALGSNVGNRVVHLRNAVAALAGVVTVEALSSLWETEPVGLRAQPMFLNAALRGRTARPARVLLATLMDIEERLGRHRRVPNGPREIDLDLIAYDALILDEPGLTLPHPRAEGRRFVLVPLAEIAADVRLRAEGRTAAELLASLPPSETVVPYAHAEWPPPLS